MTIINQIRYARPPRRTKPGYTHSCTRHPLACSPPNMKGSRSSNPACLCMTKGATPSTSTVLWKAACAPTWKPTRRVCFCVAEMGRLLPADTAMEFGVEYASVVVFGTVTVCSDEGEVRYGLQLVLDRYFPHMKSGQDYREIIPEELNITAVYRIDIQAMSGKETYEPAEFPGAFTYPHPLLKISIAGTGWPHGKLKPYD